MLTVAWILFVAGTAYFSSLVAAPVYGLGMSPVAVVVAGVIRLVDRARGAAARLP